MNLKTIRGFQKTEEAREFAGLIQERLAGAQMFAPAAVTPQSKHTLQSPSL